MVKVVVIAILLLVATYCSYQISAIVTWQKLLRQKQEQFGVIQQSNAMPSIGGMKQLRVVCATCAAITVFVPAHVFPFATSVDKDPYLAAEFYEKSDNSSIRGITQDAITNKNESSPLVTTTAMPSKPASTVAPAEVTSFQETTKVLSTLDNTKGSSLIDDWAAMNQDVTLIEEIVIETYDTAAEVLTESRVKSLLKKKLVETDLEWEQEDYFVKVKINTNTWIRLPLTSIKGNFYVRDHVTGQVYHLQ